MTRSLLSYLRFILPPVMLLSLSVESKAALTDAGGLVVEQVEWVIGDMRADPLHDLYYVADETNNRIVAYDANTGAIAASALLGVDAAGGFFEFSIDGSQLFFSTPATGALSVFTVGTLLPVGTRGLPQPVSKFVIGADGFLYAEGSTVEEGGGVYRMSYQANQPETNVRVSSLSGIVQFHRNENGTRFFLSTDSNVYELPLVDGDTMPEVLLNSTDGIDLFYEESGNILYQLGDQSPLGGSEMQELNFGDEEKLHLVGTSGDGMTTRKDSPYLFSISFSPFKGVIRSLRKSDGLPHREWRTRESLDGDEDDFFHPGKFEISPSGNLFFAMTIQDGSEKLGLIRRNVDSGLPASPVNLRASDRVYEDRILLAWEATAEVTEYAIYRSPNNAFSFSTLVAHTAETEWFDNTVETSTTYHYWVSALNGSEAGPVSWFDDDGEAADRYPQAPAWVSATRNVYHDRVKVTWIPSPEFDNFTVCKARIYRRQFAYPQLNPYELVGSVDFSSRGPGEWNDTTVTPGVEYEYGVSLATPTRESFIEEASFPLGRASTARPVAPAFLAATDGLVLDEVHLHWGFNADATSYSVFRNTEKDLASSTAIVTGLTEARYADTSVTEGERYFYWVKCVNPNGASAAEVCDSGYSLSLIPVAPDSVEATDGDHDDRIRITGYWVSNAVSYDIYRATSDDSMNASLIAQDVVALTWDDTSVPLSDTSYYYWVISKNAYGSSDISSGDVGYRKRPFPGVPGAVTATFADHGDRVTVSWNAALEADSYVVYQSGDSNFQNADVLASDVSGTSFEDYTATPGVLQWYWVRAVNSVGIGGLSLSANGVRSEPVPEPPVVVSAEDGIHFDRIMISWSSVSEANSYNVYRHTADDVGSAARVAMSVVGASWTDDSVAEGTQYYYWISGANYGGEGSPSVSEPGSTRTIILDSPQNIAATDGTYENQIRISWDSVGDATGYRIFRSDTLDGSYMNHGVASSTSYFDPSAIPGRLYFYSVIARHTNGATSAEGTPDSGYRALEAPGMLIVSAGLFQGEVRLSWAGVEGASIYRIFRGKDAEGSDALEVGTASTLQFVDTTGTHGESYYYFVVADSGSVVSSFSSGSVGYGTIGPPFRPDAMAGRKGTGLLGNNVYDSGGSQIITLKSKRAKKVSVSFAIQNDGAQVDRILATVSKGSRLFRSKVRGISGGNLTAVAASGLVSPSMVKGEQTYLFLEVSPSRKLKHKRKKWTFTCVVRSQGDSAQVDAVRAIVKTVK